MRLSVALRLLAVSVLALLVVVVPAAANTAPQTLPLVQEWTDTSLISAANDWSGVPGIIGYRGDNMTASTSTDPQTTVADGSATPINVTAQAVNPNTTTSGGIAEFEAGNAVVALQGSGTADAPHLVITVDSSAFNTVNVAYLLRDIDGSADNAVQQVALQYRIGTTGNYTNLPAGYVADATTGGSATQTTPVSVQLPAAAGNQPVVQIRVITNDAPGSDEWVGIDDIRVTGSNVDAAPTVVSTTPADGAVGVATSATISVGFSEPVTVTDPWVTITCAITGGHAATVSGGPTTYTLDPIVDFAEGETCDVSVAGASVTDQDANDPPDAMAANKTWSFTTVAPPPPPAALKVSEVYGGGGNSGATYTHDYIELYNPTAVAVPLAGWSVQYASSAGSSWQVTPLSGTIAPGGYFLVQEAAGTGGVIPLPGADVTGSIAMSGTSGKVALVASTAPLSGACPTGIVIADFVGYGAANCSETSPTGVLSNTTAAIRNGDGATDTNNNSVDFTVGAPDPDAASDFAPRVLSTTPANGAGGVALDATFTVSFSENVALSTSGVTVSCATSGAHAVAASGGPRISTLDPAGDFGPNESCTLTIPAGSVTDEDGNDPPNTMAADYVLMFQTADVLVCGGPATLISGVQGPTLASSKVGEVHEVEGIVVGDYQPTGAGLGGFYLQEEVADGDGNAATSEGIFVFDNGYGVDVAVGERVRTRGTVVEFNGLTELNANNVRGCPGGAPLSPTPVSLPVASLDDLEPFEGMLVDLDQELTVTEVFTLGRFGEVSLSAIGRLYTPTAVADPGAAAIAVADSNRRSRIILDDGNGQQNPAVVPYPAPGLSASNTLRVGDSLQGLSGVMDYRFGLYRIQPVGPVDFDATNPRTAAPAPVGGNLEIASFNVLNYFNGDGAGGGFPTARGAETAFEFERQRTKIISALTAINADIVGLMEIENDGGANTAIEDLVAGLNAAMGAGTYSYVNTGVIGTDAIRVALIYKPAAVSPVGAYELLTTTDDPRFVDTLNRPTLAQTFQNAMGARLTIAVNHLKSKGSDCNHVGDPDTGDGQGNCNVTRTNAAKAMMDWLAGDPTGSGDPDFLVIGDLNSYTFEDPITAITDAGYVNLIAQFHGLDAYSYVFNGESGYLDHALASPTLAPQASGVTDWHINPDEPVALDYNTNFKSAAQISSYYAPDPYKASDHDPVIIGLDLNSAPTVDAGGPYAVSEGGTVTVTATGADPDGGTLTYAWDLDDDGAFDDATGQSVSFSAASIDGPATRTIRVRATDGGGLTSTDGASVSVTNVAPTATFNAPATTPAGSAFTLSLTGADDAAPADTFTYAFDCGDGTGYGVFGPSNTAPCPTLLPGTRSVGGKIRDDDGGETEYRATVKVTLTTASLCALVRQLVPDAGVANSLCKKLENANAADERGNDGASDNQLDAFVLEVEAQSGKAVPSAAAPVLIALARALQEA